MVTDDLIRILQDYPGRLVTVYDGHGAGSSDIEVVMSEVLVDDSTGVYERCLHLQDQAYPCPDCSEQDRIIADLAIMVRRLITAKKPISEKTKEQCWGYLQRKGLQGSILR